MKKLEKHFFGKNPTIKTEEPGLAGVESFIIRKMAEKADEDIPWELRGPFLPEQEDEEDGRHPWEDYAEARLAQIAKYDESWVLPKKLYLVLFQELTFALCRFRQLSPADQRTAPAPWNLPRDWFLDPEAEPFPGDILEEEFARPTAHGNPGFICPPSLSQELYGSLTLRHPDHFAKRVYLHPWEEWVENQIEITDQLIEALGRLGEASQANGYRNQKHALELAQSVFNYLYFQSFDTANPEEFKKWLKDYMDLFDRCSKAERERGNIVQAHAIANQKVALEVAFERFEGFEEVVAK